MSVIEKRAQKPHGPESDGDSYPFRVQGLTKDRIQGQAEFHFESLPSMPEPTLTLPCSVLSLEPDHTV